jgi:hypothetical protein
LADNVAFILVEVAVIDTAEELFAVTSPAVIPFVTLVNTFTFPFEAEKVNVIELVPASTSSVSKPGMTAVASSASKRLVSGVPYVVQVGPFCKVPLLLFPEPSLSKVPVPSSVR